MTTNFSRKPTRSDSQFGDSPNSGRASAGAPQGLGAVLRERREAMGVSLAEVEVATRIRQKYLSALEADDWHLLPGEVVGRGFLRNYADYLGLDPQEAMDRRRAVTDANLTVALATTSAGAPLPPTREVDYRPKEVDLKDDGDGIQRGEIRLTPILTIVAVATVVVLGWWGVSALSGPIGDALGGMQAGVTGLFDRPTSTPTTVAVGVVNEQNVTGGTAGTPEGVATQATKPGIIMLGSGTVTEAAAGAAPAQPGAILVPTDTPAVAAAEAPLPTPEPPTAPPTPTPELPTPTPIPPTPTPEPPTPTPEALLPTATPTPEAPPVAAAVCADPRSVISGPGVNQVVSGVVGVSGTATHEAFQYYKLEFAPGANAAGGFVYFDGGNVQITGAFLGNFDTTSLANGAYTIRLTVVDQSGNFPPPCDVSVVIQN